MNDIDVQSMAKQTGIGPHTLRYYERIGLIPNVQRATSGHRRYSDADVEWVSFLQYLRRSGMTIRQMKEFVALAPISGPPSEAVRDYLERYRSEVTKRIFDQQEALALIDDKIKRYEQWLSTYQERKQL
jgi:DNA-binding transcriptional MerR regulator